MRINQYKKVRDVHEDIQYNFIKLSNLEKAKAIKIHNTIVKSLLPELHSCLTRKVCM